MTGPRLYGFDPDVVFDELKLTLEQLSFIYKLIEAHKLPGNDCDPQITAQFTQIQGMTPEIFKKRLALRLEFISQKFHALAEMVGADVND